MGNMWKSTYFQREIPTKFGNNLIRKLRLTHYLSSESEKCGNKVANRGVLNPLQRKIVEKTIGFNARVYYLLGLYPRFPASSENNLSTWSGYSARPLSIRL